VKDQEGSRPAVKVTEMFNKSRQRTYLSFHTILLWQVNTDTCRFVIFCATSTLSRVSTSRYVTHGAFYVRNKSMNNESTMVVEQEVPVQKYEQVKLGSHLHFWPRQKNCALVKGGGREEGCFSRS